MSSPISNAEPEQMQNARSTRWLAITVLAFSLLAAAHALVVWRLDVFGMFRDPRGRSLLTFDEHTRMVKYWLNEFYVPANFNALIVGASASVNWNAEDLTGYRFYNECLEGSNGTEQRKLVEQALQRGHYKVALVTLYPHITATHEIFEGWNRLDRREALGSVNMFDVELSTLRNRFSHTPPTSFPDGSHLLMDVPLPSPEGYRVKLEGTDQDPQAVSDYSTAMRELMDKGTRIIYVTYPLYQPHYEVNKALYAEYMASVKRNMPAAPIIDFNAPEYLAFRSDKSNFLDNVHLSPAGAEQLSKILNIQMHHVLGDQ